MAIEINFRDLVWSTIFWEILGLCDSHGKEGEGIGWNLVEQLWLSGMVPIGSMYGIYANIWDGLWDGKLT